MSVSLLSNTATRAVQSDYSIPALIPAATPISNGTFNSNLSSLESRQPQASGCDVHLSFILCPTSHIEILELSSAPISSLTWLLHNFLDKMRELSAAGHSSLKNCLSASILAQF